MCLLAFLTCIYCSSLYSLPRVSSKMQIQCSADFLVLRIHRLILPKSLFIVLDSSITMLIFQINFYCYLGLLLYFTTVTEFLAVSYFRFRDLRLLTSWDIWGCWPPGISEVVDLLRYLGKCWPPGISEVVDLLGYLGKCSPPAWDIWGCWPPGISRKWSPPEIYEVLYLLGYLGGL